MAREFLEELLDVMGVEGRVTVEEEGSVGEFKGHNMGVLIGRRGQTLDSIQYITGLVVNRKYPDITPCYCGHRELRKKRGKR